MKEGFGEKKADFFMNLIQSTDSVNFPIHWSVNVSAAHLCLLSSIYLQYRCLLHGLCVRPLEPLYPLCFT